MFIFILIVLPLLYINATGGTVQSEPEVITLDWVGQQLKEKFPDEFGPGKLVSVPGMVGRVLGSRSEIDRLSKFILDKMPEEIGRGKEYRDGESAVDIAIRLLEQRLAHKDAAKEPG